MHEIEDRLIDIVGAANVDAGADIDEDATHDEALTGSPVRPRAVVRPGSTEEVAAIVRAAASEGVPLIAAGPAPDCPEGALRSRPGWWCHSSG